MKVMLGVAGGISLVGCLVCGGCVALVGFAGNAADAKRAAERQQIASGAILPTRVSVDDLNAAYRANQVAADNTYKGRWLRIEARISNIGTGIGGGMYVVLGADTTSIEGVHCSFDSEHAGAVAKLTRGQRVTIIGKCGGKLLTDVSLDDCQFAPAETPAAK